MSNTNPQEKCFMVAFGEDELAGGAERKITSIINRNLCLPTTNEWVCPSGTHSKNTNISNVFFVKGDTSEIKLNNFYRKKIEPIVSEASNTNKKVYFYIKEVGDDEESMQL